MVFFIERQPDDLADRQSVKAHVTCVAQPGHIVEKHIVISILPVHLYLGEPEQKHHAAHEAGEGKKTDQQIIGFGFHASFRQPAARAARARGPVKYSCTQGSLTAVMVSMGPSTSTRLSERTAIRSQIA